MVDLLQWLAIMCLVLALLWVGTIVRGLADLVAEMSDDLLHDMEERQADGEDMDASC